MLTFDEAAHSGKLPERFWVRVLPLPTGCWRWLGGKHPFGHGRFHVNGRAASAHVVAYEAFIGPMPEGMFGLHRCDIPDCVNPWHVFPGTQADNMRDKCAKGRQYRPIGDLHPQRKLSADQVRTIRYRLAKGEAPVALAVEFGVHRNTIYSVKTGQNWRHAHI